MLSRRPIYQHVASMNSEKRFRVTHWKHVVPRIEIASKSEFFSLRVIPPTHPVPARAPRGPNIAQVVPTSSQTLPTSSPDGVGTVGNREKANNATKRRASRQEATPVWTKMIGSQNGANVAKKIDPYIDEYFGASRDLVLERC